VASATVLVGIGVFAGFTPGDAAVMAGRTVAQYLVVIDAFERRPGAGAVTGFAVIGGQRMGRGFTGRRGAVVTRGTGAGHVVMVEAGR